MALYQLDFLFAPPSLDLLLAGNGQANVAEYLKIHQAEDSVTRCETWHHFLTVLDKAQLKVVGHARIEGS